MTNLIVDDELAKRLEAIADRERRPLNDVLRSMADRYEALPPIVDEPSDEALESMAGMIDSDLTDLSTTVRETMQEYYRKKYGNPD
ncbi:MAG: hypothetical protein IT324_27890 [Anaerolineae bacterium]|nr:hypothetical protein [Anaerolineae bacterium]